MREEIFINGKRMEQEEGKSLSMVFQSPYFTDIDNIVSNRSTSVDFPRTPDNMQAIELGGLMQGTSLFEYNLHKAIYKRDGVQIFSGNATVLSITATAIKVSFTWGNISTFEQLLDARLRDLQTDADGDYVPWNTSAHRIPEYYPDGWNTPDAWTDATITTENENTMPIMPIMPASKIMQRITSKYGVSFSFPNNEDVFAKYYIPIIYRNADERTAEAQGMFQNSIELTTVATTIGTGYRYLSGMSSNLGGLGDDGIVQTAGIERLVVKIPAGFSVITPVGGRGSARAGVWVCDIDDTATPIATVPSVERTPVFVQGDTTQYTTYTVTQDFTLEVDATQYNAIAIVVGLNSRGSASLDTIRILTAANIVIYDPGTGEASYGGEASLPLYSNLPDWSVSDFIKNLMKIEGLFAYSTDSNVIRFVSIDDLYTNRTAAQDWTYKVMGEPTETVAKFNDLAQKNWMRYAEDDSVTGNYDGYIPTQSNTLGAENDLVELDFAATMGNKIIVWTEGDDGAEYQDVEPRILKMQADGTLSFAGMAWDALIATNYATYANLVLRPRTVRASVLLDTLDLVQYDPSVPVYVRQWGHYYAIIKLTTKDNGKADAELLQLGTATQYDITN